MSNIYYFTPDYQIPSWGIGIIYSHVQLLHDNGFRAFVLHQQQPFRIDWLSQNAPICYMNTGFHLKPDDILIVPEILATSSLLPKSPCRRIVFVQGSYFITEGLGELCDYTEHGYEQALTTMPHMQKIIETYHGVRASIIPPFVAPYFYQEPHNSKRLHKIVLVGKPEYYKAGYLDYQIAKKMILAKLNQQHLKKWTLQELLNDKSHQEVAQLFQKSTFLININSLESFNATVPEAMAAGCIPLCYEAFGGCDFLHNEKNAYVFPNNYIYPLIAKLYHLLDNYYELDKTLQQMRIDAYDTACQYTKAQTEKALVQFYQSLKVPNKK